MTKLRKALTEGYGQIEFSVSKSQLTNPDVGFLDLVRGNTPNHIEFEKEELPSSSSNEDVNEDASDTEDTPSNGPVSSLSDKLSKVDLSRMNFNVDLTPSQRSKILTANGHVSIALKKDNLDGDDTLLITDNQRQALNNAILKGSGIRLTLDDESIENFKKNLTS